MLAEDIRHPDSNVLKQLLSALCVQSTEASVEEVGNEGKEGKNLV